MRPKCYRTSELTGFPFCFLFVPAQLTATIYAACMNLVLVSGQLFGGNFGFGYNAVSGDFGGPSAFGGSLGVGPNNVRDPRQNRGEYERGGRCYWAGHNAIKRQMLYEFFDLPIL